ncbi:MAG: NAD-dependent epimerase, partial [Gemmatimonadales bacterium]
MQPVRGDVADAVTVGAAGRAADATISMATSSAQVDGPAVDAILAALSGSDKPFIYTDGIWSFGDTGEA